jgi:hypothetical protein
MMTFKGDMKGETELHHALIDSLAIFEDGVPKDYKAQKIANLVAVLEVFTDANFSEEEQSKLFNISAQRLKELQEKLK